LRFKYFVDAKLIKYALLRENMERITYVYVFIVTFVLALSVISIALIFAGQDVEEVALSESSKKTSHLSECTEIFSSEREDAINIVFISDEDSARDYGNYLLESAPFSEFKDSFRFFNLDIDVDCEKYKGIAILCHSKDLIKKASSCPNDYIIVLKEEDSYLRSSAYQSVLSINTAHPFTVLLHEIAHAIAFLAEEYFVPAGKVPKNSLNCVEECDEGFGDLRDGCYQECTTGSHFRSIKLGVMRTLQTDQYGLFNEQIIRSRIVEDKEDASVFDKITGKIVSITGSAIVDENYGDCINRKYYLGEFKQKDGELETVSEEIVRGCVGHGGSGNFKYNLRDSDGEIVLDKNFNPEIIFTSAPGTEEDADGDAETIDGDVFENEDEFIITVPVSSGTPTLEIEDENGNVIEEVKIGREPCLVG
jgi:hypothetical protein